MRSTPATCATSSRRTWRWTAAHYVIHLAAIVGGIANFHKLPHTLTEVNNGLYNAVFRAALDHEVERFTYVSSSMVFERATEFPTTEAHLPRLSHAAVGLRLLEAHRRGLLPRRPRRARPPVHDLPALQRLRPRRDARRRAGDRAHGARPDQEGALRASGRLQIFGSGEQTRTLTHIDDIADGVVTAMSSPAGLDEDFNISASRELTVSRDRAHHLGGVRRGPQKLRARAPAHIRGRRPPALAIGGEGQASCSAGRPRSGWRRHRRQFAGCAL